MADDAGVQNEGKESFQELLNMASLDAKLKQLLRNLTSIESKLCSEGSKEFRKLLKSDFGFQLLKAYIEASPKLVEILHVWDLRKGNPGFVPFLKLITAFLSHPLGISKNSRNGNIPKGLILVFSALDKLSRVIVEEKIGDLYKELSSKEPKRQNVVLLLLASIVRRGQGLAWEVAKSFDFNMESFQKLAVWKVGRNDGKRMHLTRRAFVRFAVSFLEVGNPRLLRGILQQKNMYSAVLRGLGNDDDETVTYVLSTLRNRVLTPDSLVPPGLRSVLFGRVTLEQLISISGRADDDDITAELAHNLLITVCTDPANGLMPDLGRVSNPLKGNRMRLLDLMKKLNATEVNYHRDLLLSLVKGRPAFGSAYLDQFPYNVEDLTSPNWFAAVSLAANVMSSVGEALAFGFSDSTFQDPPSLDNPEVQDILKCIGPRPFTRLVINKGLLHLDSLVKHVTLRLVSEELKLLDCLIGTINDICTSKGQLMHKWVSLKHDIQNDVRILLPDPQVLLSLVSSFNRSYKNLKRPADRELLKPNSKDKKLKVSAMNDNIDILVSGVSSFPPSALVGEDGVTGKCEVNELKSDADLVNPVPEIWGMDQFPSSDIGFEDAETIFYSKLLDALKIYHRTLPMGFEGSFDFFRILPSYPLELPTILQRSILSLLVEQVAGSHKNDIAAKTQLPMYKYLQLFITIFMYSPIRDIRNQAYTLAQEAMLSTGAFDQNPMEICTWFLFIPGSSKDDVYAQNMEIEIFLKLSSAVISFLCDAVSTIGNNLFKYLDMMRCYITDAQGAKGRSACFSPLFICVLDKCLRLLGSESGTTTLPEKSLISLYVATTVKYLLETQVEPRLMPLLVGIILSKKLEDCCNMIKASSVPCEWRPLSSLLEFSRNIMHYEICGTSTTGANGISSVWSLSDTLAEVESILGSEYHDALVGVALGFCSSMVCIPPKELIVNFPGIISISSQLLEVPFSLLSAIISLEPSYLSQLFKLWPEVCSVGMKKLKTKGHHGEGKEEIACSEIIESSKSASVAFSSFLERASFHVLFPGILFIDDSCSLCQSEVQNFLLDKLSKWAPEYYINSFCHVLSCIYRARSLYKIKPSMELKKLCDFSFLLAGKILKQCLAEIVGSNSSGYEVVRFSTHVKQVVEVIFYHPLVTETLEGPLSNEERFPDDIFMKPSESFLEFAGQVINKIDHQVMDLLRTASGLLMPLCYNHSSLPDVHYANKLLAGAFKALGDKLILILKYKFIDGIKAEDLKPLIPPLFSLHRLIDFISPFELLELVHWLLLRIKLNDTTIAPSFKTRALAVGLHTACCVIDSLAMCMVQLSLKGSQFHLFIASEKRSIDVATFQKIIIQVFEIATSFKFDLADLCLLKAIKLVRLLKHVEQDSLPYIMSVSRFLSSFPINVLSHCMHDVTKEKAELLFLICEISPSHLSVFGQLVSDRMSNCNHSHSVKDLMFLPTVLLYLDAASQKYGEKLHQHFANIISTFWKVLTHGFSNWKRYVLEDIFDMRAVECLPSSMDQFMDLVSHSLLGNAISLLQHYLRLSGHLVKLKDRLCLFNSVCPYPSKYDDLLDFNIKEVSVCSFEQSLNLANITVAKIRFCRMLLFPDNSQFHSFLEEDGKENEIHSEVSSSRLRFLNMLVKSWQLIVKKSNSDVGSSGKGENANILQFGFLETFIANNILDLVVQIRDYLIKLSSLPLIEQLARSSLLYRFEDPTTLKILRSVLASLSEGKFSCTSILQLLLSHSQFAPTLLSGCRSPDFTQFGMACTPIASIMKLVVVPQFDKDGASGERNMSMSELHMKQLELVKLLRVLFQIRAQKSNSDADACGTINLKELVLLLLSSYSAMVTEIDMEICSLINELESCDESVAETITEMDYLWGHAAVRVSKEREKEQNISMINQTYVKADEDHRRIQFREHFPIDPKLCERTLLFFPYDRSGKRNLNKSIMDHFLKANTANDEKPQVYDPFFILRFASHCLSMGYIEPLEFTSFGLLALAFLSLSSPDEDMRKLSYEVLGIFKGCLEKCEKRKDIIRLRLLLTYMQNGITEPLQRISSVIAVFVAEASFILLDSSHNHYSAISKALMRSPSSNIKGIPLFQEYFWSSSVTFKTERLWIMRLLSIALNGDDNAEIYIRNSVFENLMNFYTSPLADNESKKLIIQMVKKSVKLHKLVRYLVEQCGIISWLSSLISSFPGYLCKDTGGSQLAQLAELLEVVNEAVALRNTSEWLQNYALEQLAELSSHLYRLLFAYVEFMQKEDRIIGLILQTVMLTSKISQKRKVYQPHVTLSFGISFQLCEAVNACSLGRFSPTAELGLKAILMSNPAVTIWDMDQDKLLKFLRWAISTAAQSNVINMSRSDAAYHCVMFTEESPEENLVAKLLRWLTASVILGRLPCKSSDVVCSSHLNRSRLCTLKSLMNYREKGSGDKQGAPGCLDILAVSIFYLQQLVGIHYKLLPSAVSALCLLLFSVSTAAEPNSAVGDDFPLITHFSKIRSPPEANPAWRWSYYQPWKDLSSKVGHAEKLEEIQACQMLLVSISEKLGVNSLFPQALSLQDLESSGVFEWERAILEFP